MIDHSGCIVRLRGRYALCRSRGYTMKYDTPHYILGLWRSPPKHGTYGLTSRDMRSQAVERREHGMKCNHAGRPLPQHDIMELLPNIKYLGFPDHSFHLLWSHLDSTLDTAFKRLRSLGHLSVAARRMETR